MAFFVSSGLLFSYSVVTRGECKGLIFLKIWLPEALRECAMVLASGYRLLSLVPLLPAFFEQWLHLFSSEDRALLLKTSFAISKSPTTFDSMPI